MIISSIQRKNEINKILKFSSIESLNADLSAALRRLKEHLPEEDSLLVIRGITALLTRDSLQSSNFSSNKLENDIRAALTINELEYEAYELYIRVIIEKASQYNSEFVRASEQLVSSDEQNFELLKRRMFEDSSLNIRSWHEDHDEVSVFQRLLSELGYPLEIHGVDGKFGPETEEALIIFQHRNELTPNGILDSATFKKMIENPVRITDSELAEMQREYRRRYSERESDERRRSQPWWRVFIPGNRGVSVPSLNEQGEVIGDGALTNVRKKSSGVDLETVSPMLKEYLKILDNVAREKNKTVVITSGGRTWAQQASIMYGNYKRKGGVGSERANNYLRRLYSRYPRIDDIVNIYLRRDLSKDAKVEQARQIMEESWPVSGHGAGRSIDIRLGVDDVLLETQDLATVDILDEGDHFHVTIKSLTPGGKHGMRTFRS